MRLGMGKPKQPAYIRVTRSRKLLTRPSSPIFSKHPPPTREPGEGLCLTTGHSISAIQVLHVTPECVLDRDCLIRQDRSGESRRAVKIERIADLVREHGRALVSGRLCADQDRRLSCLSGGVHKSYSSQDLRSEPDRCWYKQTKHIRKDQGNE